MYKQLLKEIKSIAGLVLNWPANNAIQIGDYGSVDDAGEFTVRGNLRTLGIHLDIRNSDRQDVLTIQSASGVKVDINNSAEAQSVNVDLTITFDKANSVFAKIGPQKIAQIANLDRVQEHLARLWKVKQWDLNSVIITALYSSNNVILTGSTVDNASITFGAKAENEITDAALGSAAIKWDVRTTKNTGLNYSTTSEVNICYKAHIMKKGFFDDNSKLVAHDKKYKGLEHKMEEDFIMEEFGLN